MKDVKVSLELFTQLDSVAGVSKAFSPINFPGGGNEPETVISNGFGTAYFTASKLVQGHAGTYYLSVRADECLGDKLIKY